jgi:hypothetical protein
MARILKQQNFSAFDLTKLNSSLYDMKLARGTDESLARFVGWESRQEQDLALFAVKTDQGEQLRKLVFDRECKVSDPRQLKMLFALVFAARKSDADEWIPTADELEMVK